MLDAAGERALLTLHPRVHAWIQLGGHIEPGDASLAGAAAQGFQTAAPHAILIDADSGSVLFEKAADEAKAGCPVSKALTGVDITLETEYQS